MHSEANLTKLSNFIGRQLEIHQEKTYILDKMTTNESILNWNVNSFQS